MITIIKGDSKLIVSQQTFEEQYKNLGYQIASDKKEAAKEVASASIKEEKKEEEKKEDNEEKKINEKYGFNKNKTKKGK